MAKPSSLKSLESMALLVTYWDQCDLFRRYLHIQTFLTATNRPINNPHTNRCIPTSNLILLNTPSFCSRKDLNFDQCDANCAESGQSRLRRQPHIPPGSWGANHEDTTQLRFELQNHTHTHIPQRAKKLHRHGQTHL